MSCEHDIIFEITDSDDASFDIDVRDFVDRIISPNPYEGQTAVTPSDERQTLPTRGKTLATDITVLPAPVESLATSENGTFLPSDGNVGFSEVVVDVEPSLDSLSVTANGTYTPLAGIDGFDEVVVNVSAEEEWDGSLVPDENNTGFFHCKVLDLLATDTLVIDGYGTGYRWASTKSNMPTFLYWGGQFGTGDQNADAVHCRMYLVPTADTTVVIGGPAWGADGSVTATNYSFKGDYMRYKVIHAS